jgi:hypothetical protein
MYGLQIEKIPVTMNMIKVNNILISIIILVVGILSRVEVQGC